MADAKKPTAPRQNKPRPCYILLDGELPEGLNVVSSTRKAEEALEAIDAGEAQSYLRILVK